MLPEGGWQQGPETVSSPDIVVAATDSPGTDLLRASPLLVVEIASRSTRGDDLGRKLQAYAEDGAPFYWIVDPEAEVLTSYRLEHGRFVQQSRAGSPDLLLVSEPFAMSIDLAGLFA